MANPEHLAILKQGVEVWNRWRRENIFIVPDLSEANLTTDYQFAGADFSNANLKLAKIIDSNAENINFRGADLWLADLRWSGLGRSDLKQASLIGTNFTGCRCAGTEFDFATLGGTIFGDSDLSEVIGLASCIHTYPSILDFSTLSHSKSLPIPFLRGCGLPDSVIDYLPSLAKSAIQFYSCFISYSTRDQSFADRLHADLQANDVRCWFAPHDVQGGKKLHEQIDEAIRVYDRLLLILSPSSMSSEWVKTEIAKARRKEQREGRRVLFPISICSFEALRDWECFDADAGKDSAREIREYFIPDFSNWKDHDSYQAAFKRLLHDLKADAKVADIA
jgi:uncharacterized protein YjbI with pentapeptide repeats